MLMRLPKKEGKRKRLPAGTGGIKCLCVLSKKEGDHLVVDSFTAGKLMIFLKKLYVTFDLLSLRLYKTYVGE